MAIFGNLFGKNNNPISSNPAPVVNSNPMSLNLSKEQSLQQLDLRKKQVASLCLEKAPLNNLTARVCVVMDYSGSMRPLYQNGFVQAVLERLLPVAMQFDDNGEMEMWLFENSFTRLPSISLNNYYNYIKNENILGKYRMGGTYYAPVMQDVVKKYAREEPANIPTLVLFITDGNNFDHGDTNNIMKEASQYPIFWQFVGIGDATFDYLERLDNLKGRYVDNANFFAVNDLMKISDDELYRRLLNEYPEWITEIKNKNMI